MDRSLTIGRSTVGPGRTQGTIHISIIAKCPQATRDRWITG